MGRRAKEERPVRNPDTGYGSVLLPFVHRTNCRGGGERNKEIVLDFSPHLWYNTPNIEILGPRTFPARGAARRISRYLSSWPTRRVGILATAEPFSRNQAALAVPSVPGQWRPFRWLLLFAPNINRSGQPEPPDGPHQGPPGWLRLLRKRAALCPGGLFLSRCALHGVSAVDA